MAVKQRVVPRHRALFKLRYSTSMEMRGGKACAQPVRLRAVMQQLIKFNFVAALNTALDFILFLYCQGWGCRICWLRRVRMAAES